MFCLVMIIEMLACPKSFITGIKRARERFIILRLMTPHVSSQMRVSQKSRFTSLTDKRSLARVSSLVFLEPRRFCVALLTAFKGTSILALGLDMLSEKIMQKLQLARLSVFDFEHSGCKESSLKFKLTIAIK